MASTELTFTETFQIKTGKTVAKDFFYIPVFYFKRDDGDGGWTWFSMRFDTQPAPDSLTAYASKVSARTSLKSALIRDLSQDFSYPANQTFVIDEIAARDTARDRHGDTLTRLLVIVGLDAQIDLENVHPLGMNLHWYEEGSDEYNVVKKHFPNLSLDLYHSQSYVHIPMDGSQPADPSRGPTDDYYLPDGSLIEPAPPIWY